MFLILRQEKGRVHHDGETTKAIELHGKGYNCFQSVACVFAPELDVDEVTAFRMGEGFGLGMGDMSQTCGAITGAVACMGLLNSAGDLDTPNTTKRATMGLASTLTARFWRSTAAASARY